MGNIEQQPFLRIDQGLHAFGHVIEILGEITDLVAWFSQAATNPGGDVPTSDLPANGPQLLQGGAE